MRFVSHIARFKISIIPERAHFSNFGDRIIDQEGFMAHFNQNEVTDADVSFVERTFALHGKQTLQDEVTPVPTIERVSVYDTTEEAVRNHWRGRVHVDQRGEEWDFQDYVERRLLDESQGHDDFRLHEAAKEPPPWPRYMDFQGTLDQLFAKIEEDGHDYRQVLAFERQNARRPVLIEALEAKISEQDALLVGAEIVPA